MPDTRCLATWDADMRSQTGHVMQNSITLEGQREQVKQEDNVLDCFLLNAI